MATRVQLIEDNAVTTPSISNGQVTADDIASNAVTNDKISNGTIGAGKLAGNSVSSSNLSSSATNDNDRAVGTNHIKDSAVTNDKISNGTIGAGKLAGNSVSSSNLSSSATNDNDRAVGTNHIKDGAVTAGKLAGDVSAYLSFPLGGIVMWSGTIAQIPPGWYLCDGGTYGGLKTPDLRNKFIVCSTGNGTGTAADPSAGPGFDVTNGTRARNYTTHDVGGEDAHKLTIAEMPSHSHGYTAPQSGIRNFTGNPASTIITGGTGSTTDPAGSSGFHENRPPYYALAYIMKCEFRAGSFTTFTTTTPTLQELRLNGAFYDQNSQKGNAGNVLTSLGDGNGVKWQPAGLSLDASSNLNVPGNLFLGLTNNASGEITSTGGSDANFGIFNDHSAGGITNSYTRKTTFITRNYSNNNQVERFSISEGKVSTSNGTRLISSGSLEVTTDGMPVTSVNPGTDSSRLSFYVSNDSGEGGGDIFSHGGTDGIWGIYNTSGVVGRGTYFQIANEALNGYDSLLRMYRNGDNGQRTVDCPYPGTLFAVNGTKNFVIDHPLDETKQLVHVSVEGPRADLIYRGSIQLQNGTASINLDQEYGLIPGTWKALCRNPQVWVTSADGWEPCKGFVTDEILTIQSKDPDCTETVNWLVVAERQDAAMYTPANDENGRPILEPNKIH